MTVALAWVRKHATLAWAALAFILGAVGALLVRNKRRFTSVADNGTTPIELAADAFDRRVAVAKARADIEIAAARTDNAQLLLRMHAVLSDPDPDRMVDDMVTLAEQARGAGKP